MIAPQADIEQPVYRGEFGEFVITKEDRLGVIVYRCGLAMSAIAFSLGSYLVISQGLTPVVTNALTVLFGIFSLGLGISLLTIHIYLESLHRVLQIFWLVGSLSALAFSLKSDQPLALYVAQHPLSLFGIGFIFAALTGIYFKEGFCFHRLETKILTPLVPILLLGHLTGVLPSDVEKILLGVWAICYLVFVVRKAFQAIPPDIGDKSVFVYLKQQKAS